MESPSGQNESESTATVLRADVTAGSSEVPVASDQWTTRKLRAWLKDALGRSGVDEAELCADLLLCHVLKCDKLKLFTELDRLAQPAERDALRAIAARALKHEPVQYLTGEAYFFSMRIKVDPRVLVPRQCTGTLVEHVLQMAARQEQSQRSGATSEGVDQPAKLFKRGRAELPAWRIADVCTGSGCIALALAKNMPRASILATDISPEAIGLAQENAKAHDLSGRVTFAAGDGLAALGPAAATFDVITANPPYIPDDEWADVPRNVREFEPALALRGGGDGLRVVGPLLQHAAAYLKVGGYLAIEVASRTTPECEEMLQRTGKFDEVSTLKDLDGLPRIVIARRNARQ